MKKQLVHFFVLLLFIGCSKEDDLPTKELEGRTCRIHSSSRVSGFTTSTAHYFVDSLDRLYLIDDNTHSTNFSTTSILYDGNSNRVTSINIMTTNQDYVQRQGFSYKYNSSGQLIEIRDSNLTGGAIWGDTRASLITHSGRNMTIDNEFENIRYEFNSAGNLTRMSGESKEFEDSRYWAVFEFDNKVNPLYEFKLPIYPEFIGSGTFWHFTRNNMIKYTYFSVYDGEESNGEVKLAYTYDQNDFPESWRFDEDNNLDFNYISVLCE